MRRSLHKNAGPGATSRGERGATAGASIDGARRAETTTRGGVVFGSTAFFVLFVVLGGWMAWTPISGAVVATGEVAVKGEPKTVQHLDGGIVAAIAVQNGDVVKAGDTLIRLDETLLAANREIYRNRLMEALARRARLLAERDGEATITWVGPQHAPLGIVPNRNIRQSQQTLLDARRASRTGQLQQLDGKIAQYKNQIDGVKGLQNAKQQQISFITQELSGLKRLYEAGNTTLTRLLALERQKANLLGQQAEHDAQLARIANLISETKIQIVQVDRESHEKVLAELRQTEQDINELIQQFHATREKLNRVVIKAPTAGMVHQLSVSTIGGVIAPGVALMQVVPTQDAMDIVARIDPQFIDDVHLGQSAVLRFTTLGQHDAPQLTGHVRSISPSAIVHQKTGRSYYSVRIDVSPDALIHLGKQGNTGQRSVPHLRPDRLVPGMPVDVFIRKQDRTVLSFIARPLADQVMRAFRED